MNGYENGLAGRRVFVIEDESLVTMILEDALADLGCTVTALASRFADAMDKAKFLSFDVAVLDVNLDGQKTFPIAEALIARGMPFVFATGYGTSALPESLRNVPVLHKPYQQADLERALRTALHAKA